MSPTVVAWMVRAGVPPAFFGALRTRPTVVPASRTAEVPAAAATVIAPASVLDVPGGDREDGGDRGGGGERLHDGLLGWLGGN
jgi:hypothetical protein